MKVLKVFAILALVASPVLADQAFEPASAGSGPAVPPDPGAPVWAGPRAVLYDNGPLVTHPGGGAGGADASYLQTALGMTIYGFGHALSSGYRVADQFTVPAGQTWDLTNITTFAYQTGSGTTSTINSVSIEIRNAAPPGGTVVWGDTTTNVFSSSSWSNIYRVLDTSPGDTARPIMATVANTPVSNLGAGTYWISWQVGGTGASGPWAPPVSIVGQTATGDALQFDGSTWSPLTDVGGQGLPFIIEGTVQGGGGGGGGGGGTGGAAEPIPTLSKTGVVVLVLALIGIAAVLIRRRM
jgi:hypothetical protein